MQQLFTEQARTERLARLFPGVPARPRPRRRVRLGVLLLLLPTLLAGLYYGLMADDRYVSEARFLIRSGAKPVGLGGVGALLQLAGLSKSQDDAYVVRDFLQSRDALRELAGKVNLPLIYHHRDADLLTDYPSPLYPATQEGLYRYFKQRLSVIVNMDSGLTTLRVEAFRPAQAQQIAAALLGMGEDLVNRLNERMRNDTIRVAADEVGRAQERRIAAEVAITKFRNQELMVDPGKSSAMVLQLIGKLAVQEAELRAQVAALQASAPTSPQLPPLLRQAAAMQEQIGVEQARVGSGSDGLADKIAAYERLILDQDFATRLLTQSMAALEAGRGEARRQALYLERVVEPGRPDEAAEPERVAMVLTAFGFNVLGVGLLWLLGTGLREHAAGTQLTWMRSRTR